LIIPKNLSYKDDPEYDEKWNGDLDEWKALGKKVNVYKVVIQLLQSF
jgi:hypothetical protein